jgi:hypothetical protein
MLTTLIKLSEQLSNDIPFDHTDFIDGRIN